MCILSVISVTKIAEVLLVISTFESLRAIQICNLEAEGFFLGKLSVGTLNTMFQLSAILYLCKSV